VFASLIFLYLSVIFHLVTFSNQHIKERERERFDEMMRINPTPCNQANNPLKVPMGPITRARANKLKEALNELVQKIWSKMDVEELGRSKEH